LGAVVLFIAYLFALEALEIATKTLASITLVELFAFVFLSIFAVCLFYLAVVIVFGEGPSEWEKNKEKEERQERLWVEVEEARVEVEENAGLSDAQQDRRTWIKKQSMKAGRVVGRLFKKTRN
jgi:predicted membrane protein